MDDIFVFHATTKKALPSILANGFAAGSYFSTEEIMSYYAEVIADEGNESVIFKIPLSRFNESSIHPDIPGLQEPITTVLGMSEDDVSEEWENCDQTGLDCFKLIGSFKYGDTLRVSKTDIQSTVNAAVLEDLVKIPNNPIFFHVTLKNNVISILKDGLEPRIGELASEKEEPVPAIYLFPNKDSLETAMMNWLGQAIEDLHGEIECRILAIDGSDILVNVSADYEYVTPYPIPSNKILAVLNEDAEMTVDREFTSDIAYKYYLRRLDFPDLFAPSDAIFR